MTSVLCTNSLSIKSAEYQNNPRYVDILEDELYTTTYSIYKFNDKYKHAHNLTENMVLNSIIPEQKLVYNTIFNMHNSVEANHMYLYLEDIVLGYSDNDTKIAKLHLPKSYEDDADGIELLKNNLAYIVDRMYYEEGVVDNIILLVLVDIIVKGDPISFIKQNPFTGNISFLWDDYDDEEE